MKLKSISAIALSTIMAASSAQAVDVNMLYIGDTKAYNEILEGAAKSYMAEHPDVNIILLPMENEALKAKLPTMLQSNDPPDIFTSWGGGVMLDHYNAGYLADLSAEKDSMGQIVVPSAVSAFQVEMEIEFRRSGDTGDHPSCFLQRLIDPARPHLDRPGVEPHQSCDAIDERRDRRMDRVGDINSSA